MTKEMGAEIIAISVENAGRVNDLSDRDRIIAWCKTNGKTCQQPTRHQIKVGPWNFYPATGTIIRDGEPRCTEKGADAFIALLEGERRDRLALLNRASPTAGL